LFCRLSLQGSFRLAIALASRWLPGDNPHPKFVFCRLSLQGSFRLAIALASRWLPGDNPHLDSAPLRFASSRCVLSPYTDFQEQFRSQASLRSPVPEICARLVISAGFPRLMGVDVE